MRRLYFLSRVAFICNLFFLLSLWLQRNNWIGNEQVVSTIVVLGYGMAVLIFNPLVNAFYLAVAIRTRNWPATVPRWLVVSNAVFLLFQFLFILFFLNDTFHY